MEPAAYKKYEKAKKRVTELKGFYNHVKVFVFITIMVLIGRYVVIHHFNLDSNTDPDFVNWLNINIFGFPVVWAIVVLIHGLVTFKVVPKLLGDWEERKIKEYMEEEQSDTNN